MWLLIIILNLGEYFTSSGRYKGEFINNLEHGLGKKIFPDESEYNGDWRQGLPHGRG